jgi:DNA-binding NarL/FixJ family response regulator
VTAVEQQSRTRGGTVSRTNTGLATTTSRSAPLDAEDLRLLRLLSEGLPLEAVARQLYLSDRTVRRRTRAICERLRVSTPIEAVVWAVRRKLV